LTGLAFEMLEPYEGKLSRTCLRGLGAGNSPWLPDRQPVHTALGKSMESKKVLIVGGSKGIGKEIAEVALRKHKVYVVARTKNQLLEEAGVNFIISDFGYRHVAGEILRKLIPDILVLSAAKGLCKNILDIEETDIIEVTNNTFAYPLVWITEALKNLRTGSKVGWISSLTAKIPNKLWATYAASKSAVEHYIRCISSEAVKKGISLTICYPGCVDTNFHIDSGAMVPANAIKPEEISIDMFAAIESGVERWVAPMDIKIKKKIDDLSPSRIIELREVCR